MQHDSDVTNSALRITVSRHPVVQMYYVVHKFTSTGPVAHRVIRMQVMHVSCDGLANHRQLSYLMYGALAHSVVPPAIPYTKGTLAMVGTLVPPWRHAVASATTGTSRYLLDQSLG